MGWNNDGIMKKIIDFCHFELWESEKIPGKTIRNGHFKPIFMRFFATNSGAKTWDIATTKLIFNIFSTF